ncbi:expressed unknown protein [Seminavis robusta]|uniref:Uncharacterized protein n=1 Tax=Seminavis robusta TaxID=568900 RepID=A0A9N8DKE6_9STRA|nr:expressed unknown protein [Seminavis robusta]|eukprot:Sro106_g053650.1 n/a (436) ;mRNA; f:103430-104737
MVKLLEHIANRNSNNEESLQGLRKRRVIAYLSLVMVASFVLLGQYWETPLLTVNTIKSNGSSNHTHHNATHHNSSNHNATRKSNIKAATITPAPTFPKTKNETIPPPLPVDPPPLPRIAYIAMGHLNSTDRWDGCLHPATDYFVPSPDPYYIVMNEQWRAKYEQLVETNSTFQNYSSRIQPIYTDCMPEAKGWPSCCKQDQGLAHFYKHYYSDATNQNKKYDWICFQDDDEYIRHRAMQEFLRYLPITDEPIVIASDPPEGHPLGQSGYIPKRSPYKCPRDSDNWKYPWGQPVFYNQAAFELLLPAWKAGAMTKQCKEFDLYAHDTGNALLHWMFGIPALWMRNPASVKSGMRNDFLGMHSVSRFGPQSSMKAVHEKYRDKMPYPYNNDLRPQYMWSSNATGFNQTKTYQLYGHPSTWGENWHIFPTSDCQQSFE